MRLRKTSFLLEGEAFRSPSKARTASPDGAGGIFLGREIRCGVGESGTAPSKSGHHTHSSSQNSVLSHSLILHESTSKLGSSSDIIVNNPQSKCVGFGFCFLLFHPSLHNKIRHYFIIVIEGHWASVSSLFKHMNIGGSQTLPVSCYLH